MSFITIFYLNLKGQKVKSLFVYILLDYLKFKINDDASSIAFKKFGN
jgi:hypothetical protein